MGSIVDNEATIAEQAAYWVGALEGSGERESVAFASWLRASPQHVQAFLMAMALEKEIGELDLAAFNVEALLQQSGENVVRLGAAGAAPVPNASYGAGEQRWSMRIAAAVFLAIAGWWSIIGPGSWRSYTTAVGEQRTFELADGSLVELNPFSRLKVKFTDQARDLRLVTGEAVFKVKRDPTRPFQVRSNDTIVRAVGTEFAVYRRSASVTVSVLEGRVEVSDSGGSRTSISHPPATSASLKQLLAAGEQVKIRAGQHRIERLALETAPTTERRRSLTFSGDTLAEIAEDFNRYNRAPQIRIEGDGLRERQFSGVFDAYDPRSLVSYLAQDERLAFENTDGEIVIRER